MVYPVSSNAATGRPISLIMEKHREDTPLREENRGLEISALTGVSPNEVTDRMDSGDFTPLVDAKKQAEGTLTLAGMLNQSQEQKQNQEDALRQLASQAQKISDLNGNTDVSLEAALTVGDQHFSPALARAIVNQQIAAEVFEEAIQKNDEGSSTFGQIGDFADKYFIRQIPFGALEDLSYEGVSKSEEILNAQASMSADEFTVYIKQYAAEKAQEGVFRKDNIFALQQGLEVATAAGYIPSAKWDALFAVGDLLPIAGKIGKVGTKIVRGKLLTRIAPIKGPVAASEAHQAITKSSTSVHPEIAVEAHASAFDATTTGATRPVVSMTGAHAVDSQLVDKITAATNKGTFGRRATAEQVASLARDIQTKLKETTSRPIADFNIVDLPLGGKQATFKLGRISDGAPYLKKAPAEAMAKRLTDNGIAVTVDLVDETNPKLGYFVTARESLDLSSVASGIDDVAAAGNFFTRSIAKALGSTKSLDSKHHNNLANMGEAGFAVLKSIAKEPLRILEKTNLESQEIIGKVYTKLRDGEDAFIRDGYSPLEFAEEFYEASGRTKRATEADHASFYAAKTINDTAYLMKAKEISKRYIKAGYKAVQTNIGGVLARQVTSAPADKDIYDVAAQAFVRAGDEIPYGTAIWRSEMDDYFIRPKSVSNIEYHHVLGYNSGGQRLNPDANFFITLGEGNGKAVMTAFSEKDAKIAKLQIKNIQDELIVLGRPLRQLVDELDDVIARNNSWAPTLVYDTASLQAFAERKGWNLVSGSGEDSAMVANPVSYKARGGNTVDGDHEVWGGASNDLFYQAQQGRRADRVLMDYGTGLETLNDGPVKAMVDQLANEFSAYSHSNYTESITASWVAKAKALGITTTAHANRAAFDDMFNKLTARSNHTAEERSLIQVGNIARRRMGLKDPMTRGMEHFGQEMREFVFDTTGLKVPKVSIVSGLLNMGFQSAFGFFNIGQFVMQASQVSSIIALSPKAGLKASYGAPALRLALHNGTPEAVRRIGRVLGVSEKDAKELFEYIMVSGRYDVGNDAMEKATGPGWSFKGWGGKSHIPREMRKGLYAASSVGKKVLKAGTAPFTEGERLSRLTAITTAFLEHKKRLPNVSAMEDNARAWIANREQDLTFNMGTASKAALQQGVWRLPSQWTAYSFRAMEAVVIGRDLSKAERIRLGLILVGQGGTAGVFAAGAADWISEKFDMDPNGAGVAAVKYGFYDGVLSAFFSGVSGNDVQTAMGTRLAPLGTFMDIYRKVTEENTLTALGGPSVEIVGAGVVAAYEAIGNIFNGHTASAWEDIERVLRAPTGIDNIVKARGIINHNVYRSKTGASIPLPFTAIDGVLQGLGITNYSVADYYDSKSHVWRETKDVKEFTKDLQKSFQHGIDLIREGKEADGIQLLNEVNARIDISGFSPLDIHGIRTQMRVRNSTPLAQWYFERHLMAAGKRVENQGTE